MDTVFNKEHFSDLLKKAKGSRSINQYANVCGVSAAHISRFIRCLITTPPSPHTIQKLVLHAHNGVTYSDVMICCGHTRLSATGDNELIMRVLSELESELEKSVLTMKESRKQSDIGVCMGITKAIEIVNTLAIDDISI